MTAFRREGVESAGLKQIMQEMGLTVGGFYRHFSSKSELVQSALTLGLLQSIERMRQVPDDDSPDDDGPDDDSIGWIERFAAGYLSEPHRRSIAHGCVPAALASDIARERFRRQSRVRRGAPRGARGGASPRADGLGRARRKTLGLDGP